ncbi:MAG: SurA N-terminal domain-containing protein [Spirochaetales bacterium]|nr:SurA N-terminal domain-containing protein [Spirochaetales bacterium]MCF7939596.1 SurA N-terminal domain-containing protein [Spirochaetales bacterium]
MASKPKKTTSRSQKDTSKNQNQPQKEQKNKKTGLYIFSFIILVVVIVAFVGAPLVSNLGGPGKLVFGSYGGEEIKYIPGNYFAQQRNMVAEQVREGAQNQDMRIQAYQVWKSAFQRTVLHTAILQRARQSGFYVTEEQVDAALAEYPAYQENGEFSQRRYEDTSSSDRFTYRKLVRENLIHQAYMNDLFENTHTSEAELAFFKEMAGPQRKVRYTTYSFEDYPEEEVATYGRENSELFRRMKLSRITINTGEDEAREVYSRVQEAPAGFAEMARTYSSDSYSEKGGDMGSRYFYELETELTKEAERKEVFSLEEGELSNLYKTSFGWVFYRCDEPARQPDFTSEETLGKVRNYISRFERGMVEDYLLARAEELRGQAQSEGFATAARNADRTIGTSGFFAINYGNVPFFRPVQDESGSGPLSSAAYNEEFFRKVFSSRINAVPEPMLVNNSVFLVQVLDEREAQDSSRSMIDAYAPYILQSFLEEDLQQDILQSDKLKDNFDRTFATQIAPPQQAQ